MRIAEIFASVQGEGSLTGVPSIFVRTSGCNLRCWYCDTPYASWYPEGENRCIQDIVQQVIDHDCEHVVITGGEPLIAVGIEELTQRLAEHGCHITIETAGTVIPKSPLRCHLMSISPKLSNSAPDPKAEPEWHLRHEKTRHCPEVVRQLMHMSDDYQLKFVVSSVLDAEEVLEYLNYLPEVDRLKVLLMPRGTTHDELKFQVEWLRPWCDQHQLKVCDRMHIHWFGNVRGT